MQQCGYGWESSSEAQAGCGSGNVGERLGGFGEGNTAVEEERNHEEINEWMLNKIKCVYKLYYIKTWWNEWLLSWWTFGFLNTTEIFIYTNFG